MKEEIKFSVVMPVYNVERYLEKAVLSVLNQTYKNFELILVDDCTPDKSGEICDDFAKTYTNVKSIHLSENLGLSMARNTGMNVANGDYIFFMDSDDYIDLDLFENIVNSIRKNKAQVVVFGIQEEYYDKNGIIKKQYPILYGEEKLLKTFESLRKEIIKLEMKTFYGYAWNKFYDLKYLRNISASFRNVVLIEDIDFNVKVFQNIDSLNILNIAPYHYRKATTESLTNKFLPKYFEVHRERIQMILNQQKSWGICTNQTKMFIANLYVRYIFSALQRNCDKRSLYNFKDRRIWLKQLYNENLFNELICYAKSNNKLLAIMISVLKRKNIYVTLVIARVIYLVKNKMPYFFSKVKQVKN